jgi:hypothetical protein
MSTNPYESPTTAGGVSQFSPGPEKPVAGIVFGILNLVFGVLGICGIAFSAIILFIPLDPEMVRGNPALRLMQENQFYKLFTQVGIVLGTLAHLAQIISGIGLLTMKSYGRTLALVYGWYAIIATVLTVIVNVFIVFPALYENMNVARPGPEQAGAIGGIIGGVIGIVIAPIYPGLLLFFMYRPKVIAAYQN